MYRTGPDRTGPDRRDLPGGRRDRVAQDAAGADPVIAGRSLVEPRSDLVGTMASGRGMVRTPGDGRAGRAAPQ
jgi:hypothetical protein